MQQHYQQLVDAKISDLAEGQRRARMDSERSSSEEARIADVVQVWMRASTLVPSTPDCERQLFVPSASLWLRAPPLSLRL